MGRHELTKNGVIRAGALRFRIVRQVLANRSLAVRLNLTEPRHALPDCTGITTLSADCPLCSGYQPWFVEGIPVLLWQRRVLADHQPRG